MTKALTLLTIPLMALSMAACTSSSDLPPGQYETNSNSVDSNGTARSVDANTNVYYDENGNKRVDVEKTTTTDPKGLMNKSTTTQSYTK